MVYTNWAVYQGHAVNYANQPPSSQYIGPNYKCLSSPTEGPLFLPCVYEPLYEHVDLFPDL